jgi:hypothetical protein
VAGRETGRPDLPPSPSRDPVAFEAPAFVALAVRFVAVFVAPAAFDAAVFEAAVFEAAVFEAAVFEAAVFEAAFDSDEPADSSFSRFGLPPAVALVADGRRDPPPCGVLMLMGLVRRGSGVGGDLQSTQPNRGTGRRQVRESTPDSIGQ